jgi:hypothetical protein
MPGYEGSGPFEESWQTQLEEKRAKEAAVDRRTPAFPKRLPKSCRATQRFPAAMRRPLQSGLAAAVLVVAPKDEQAARFYYRYGFLDIGAGRTQLYMPAIEIEKTLS